MSRPHRYILKDREPVPADDLMVWARWVNATLGQDACRVAKTTIGDVEVSTVFLTIDHNWLGGAPLLFETMVFGGTLDQEQERYSTWEAAERGHAAIVARVMAAKVDDT